MDVFNIISNLSKQELNSNVKVLLAKFLSFTHQSIHDNLLTRDDMQEQLITLIYSFNHEQNNHVKIENKLNSFIELFTTNEDVKPASRKA